MSPPLPNGEMTQEQAMKTLDTMFLAATICAPLVLSKTVSVALGDVSRYEVVELVEDFQIAAPGKKGKEIQLKTVYPAGSDAPVVFLKGGAELVLTPEQDAIFRPVWGWFGHNIDNLVDILERSFPRAAAIDEPGEAAIEEQGGEPS